MVSSSDEIGKAVFELVEKYNGRSLLTFRRYQLKPQTDLNGDFRMLPEDAYELMESYVDIFNIDPQEIEFSRYFPLNEGEPHTPLTIALLIESAKAGRWLDA